MKIGYRYFKTKVDKGVQIMIPLNLILRPTDLKAMFPGTYNPKTGVLPWEAYVEEETEIRPITGDDLSDAFRQTCWIVLGFSGDIPEKYLSDRNIKEVLAMKRKLGRGYVHAYSQVYFTDDIDWEEIYKRTTTVGWATIDGVPDWHSLIDLKTLDRLINQFNNFVNWKGMLILEIYRETLIYDGIYKREDLNG